jgi:hypothetical protein
VRTAFTYLAYRYHYVTETSYKPELQQLKYLRWKAIAHVRSSPKLVMTIAKHDVMAAENSILSSLYANGISCVEMYLNP